MIAILQKIIHAVAAVAPTVANIALPGSGTLVEGLMRAVTGDNDRVPIEQVAEKIQDNPQLMIELQRLAVEREIGLARAEAEKAKADTERIKAVNATMNAESKSEKWPQYAWRPFNGFLFGLSIVLIYFVLPLTGKMIPAVPHEIWIGWGAVLGVTTWDRGKEKRTKAGDVKQGLIAGAIGAIRGK